MSFLQNAFRRNNTQQPKLEFIQLDEYGNIDPAATARLEMQTEPRTLGQKLFGKFDTRDIQQIDPDSGEAKLATVTSYQPGFFNNLASGYNDNYSNGFNINNLKPDSSKNFSTRLGEGLGTLGRFVDSPAGRGLIAAGLNSALGYDNSLQEGLTAFSGRQNAVTADRLYRNQLKQYGYTDNDLAQIKGTITSDIYKNLSQDIYRNRQIQAKLAIAGAKDNTTKAKMILDAYKNGILTEQDALLELASNGIDIKSLTESNQTRNTNSQIGYRNEILKQNQQKIGILQQRVANGMASEAEKSMLRKLTIEQKQLENQILGNYINDGGNPTPTRPVGEVMPTTKDPLGIR